MIVAHAEENVRLLVSYINSRHINREDILTIVPEKDHFCVIYFKNK